eukprot:g3084.t1
MAKPTAAAPSWATVRQAGEDVLKGNNVEALTWGQFKEKLAKALDVDILALKVHREALQELIAKYTRDASQQDSDEENQDERAESDAMTAMRAMVRAMSLGPKPFVGLKQMRRKDAENTLKIRLIEAGAKFKGLFPSAREIAQARRKTETAKDLEGIDMSNIVAGSRRTRRSEEDNTSPPKKKRRSVEGPDSDCSEEDNSSEEDFEEEFELSA